MQNASILALVATVAAASVLACSNPEGEGPPEAEAASQEGGAAVTSALTSQFETVSGHLLSAAEQVPEEQYSFRPTEEVRDLGGILDHVSDAHYAYCSSAAGEDMPEAAQTEAETKAEIVERFENSRNYCLDIYGQAAPDGLGQTVNVFGSDNTQVGVLVQNVSHDNLHYGNIVTYMRSIDMVPPSSQ